jgi:phenylalanyl-tRNA synthetase beta chain
VTRARIFEIGRVFWRTDALQPMHVGALAFGSADPEQWSSLLRPVDFFDVKGDLEVLASPLDVATPAAPRPWLHPGRSADVLIDGRPAGWIGELHPKLLGYFELPSAPVAFEVDLSALVAVPMPRTHAVSRLPSVRRDLAVIINENIPVADILKALRELRLRYIETIDVFDVYRGPELPNGRKSVAILVLMRDTERTLTDEDSERIVAELLATLHARFGATLRT